MFWNIEKFKNEARNQFIISGEQVSAKFIISRITIG